MRKKLVEIIAALAFICAGIVVIGCANYDIEFNSISNLPVIAGAIIVGYIGFAVLDAIDGRDQ